MEALIVALIVGGSIKDYQKTPCSVVVLQGVRVGYHLVGGSRLNDNREHAQEGNTIPARGEVIGASLFQGTVDISGIKVTQEKAVFHLENTAIVGVYAVSGVTLIRVVGSVAILGIDGASSVGGGVAVANPRSNNSRDEKDGSEDDSDTDGGEGKRAPMHPVEAVETAVSQRAVNRGGIEIVIHGGGGSFKIV